MAHDRAEPREVHTMKNTNEETMLQVLALLIPSTLDAYDQQYTPECSWEETNDALMHWEDRDQLTTCYLAEILFSDATPWKTIREYSAAAMRMIADMGEDRAREIAAELTAA